LVSFYGEPKDAVERADIRRDLGVALCRNGPQSASFVLPLLEAAVALRSDDVAAWEAKGHALGSLGRDHEAMSAFRRALGQEPARESTLVAAAYLAVKMDRRTDAAAYWQRAVNVNPWRSDYHAELALVYFRDRNWQASADACRAALRLNSCWVDVRKWLVQCYLHLGSADVARSELETVLGFDPPDRSDLLRSVEAILQSGGRAP
jgi:tetratricopeptide (TPR) repeat protein